MNERLKELIEQATTKREFYPAGCNGYPEYRYDFDQEKFAELIVQECVKVCNQIYFDNYPDAEDWERSEEGDAILKHFEIEK